MRTSSQFVGAVAVVVVAVNAYAYAGEFVIVDVGAVVEIVGVGVDVGEVVASVGEVVAGVGEVVEGVGVVVAASWYDVVAVLVHGYHPVQVQWELLGLLHDLHLQQHINSHVATIRPIIHNKVKEFEK